MSHKLTCWCGLTLNPKKLHYPHNNPNNGPSHYPHSPCLTCGLQPHSGPCYSNDPTFNPFTPTPSAKSALRLALSTFITKES